MNFQKFMMALARMNVMYATLSMTNFLNLFTEILNKHLPVKQRYVRANQEVFTTKELIKFSLLKKENINS